jgi:hypothetical protein
MAMKSIKASSRNAINDVVLWTSRSGNGYIGTVLAIRQGVRPNGDYGTQVIVNIRDGVRRSFYEEEADVYNDGPYNREMGRVPPSEGVLANPMPNKIKDFLDFRC